MAEQGLARIQPEELPRCEAGEDVCDQREPGLVEETFALLLADRYSAVVSGVTIAGHANIRIFERAVVPRARPVIRRDEELTVMVDGRQHPFVGRTVCVGRRENDRRPDLGLKRSDCCHAAGVGGGENAETQGGDGSLAHQVSEILEIHERSYPPPNVWALSCRPAGSERLVECQIVPWIDWTALWPVSCSASYVA